MSNNIHAYVIHNPHELDRLAQSWTSLESESSSPMHHYIWSQACVNTFDDELLLHVVSIDHGENQTAIAPLVRRDGLIPVLESIGVRELYEPMDFLYANYDELELLAKSLAEQDFPLYLGRLRADSPVITAIKTAYHHRGWVHTAPVDAYPYIDLNSEWMEPEKQFNSGRRSDFRRAQRNAERIGKTSVEILSPAPAELSPLLDEALQVEKAGWKGTNGSALALDPVRQKFFRRYTTTASERGILRLLFFRIGDRTAAMQIAIESNSRFWLLKIGYDEQYSRCSPGTLLMLYSLKYAASRGLRSYEFLGAAEPWTRAWTTHIRPCVSLGAYPFGYAGILALSRDTIRNAEHMLKRKIRGRL